MFECLNKLYLIFIDCTSKYHELAQLPNASSDTIIAHARSIFARHGIPKVVFSDNRPQYSSYEFKKFSKSWDFMHKTSSFHKTSNFPSSLRVMDLLRKLFKPLRKLYENAERMTVIHTSPCLRYAQRKTAVVHPSLLIKKKVANTSSFTKRKHNTKTKVKKPKVSQYRELQPLNTNGTVCYRLNNNWTRSRMIPNKNNMPRSYILLNDKNNVMRRNRRHLIKMNSNFVKVGLSLYKIIFFYLLQW